MWWGAYLRAFPRCPRVSLGWIRGFRCVRCSAGSMDVAPQITLPMAGCHWFCLGAATFWQARRGGGSLRRAGLRPSAELSFGACCATHPGAASSAAARTVQMHACRDRAASICRFGSPPMVHVQSLCSSRRAKRLISLRPQTSRQRSARS